MRSANLIDIDEARFPEQLDGVREIFRSMPAPSGRRLTQQMCQFAKAQGYQHIRLDTMPFMTAAQQLYASLGFKSVAAYVYNPVEGTRFMERDLQIPLQSENTAPRSIQT